jgi:5-formyltetrahydrofolate cyclo-ligase
VDSKHLLLLAKSAANTYSIGMDPGLKRKIRNDLIAARKALTPEKIQKSGAAICRRISELDAWGDAREVLAYMPVDGEVDVTPLVEDLWRRGSRVLLPRCRPGEPGVMDLACPAGMHEVAPGAYGIPEPVPDTCPSVDYCSPQLVLVPGVAFDESGMRIGMGGGYYDRLLASGKLGGALLVSPAYTFQLVGKIPKQAWDKPVNVIITEERTIWTRNS